MATRSRKVTKITNRALCLILLGAGSLWGASPTLTDLSPHGGPRGKAFTLTLVGSGLEGATVISTLPASFTPLAPKESGNATTGLSFLMELKADAAIGVYPIRVRTAEGLSNVMLFSVGAFPETMEAESEPMAQDYSNDSPEKAQRVEWPVTINGKLRGYDQDFYRFQAKKGDRLVFEVEARRVGSAVDPMIRVLDAAGRELARNDDAPGLGVDCRVEVTFPDDGEYLAVVQDSKFSVQAQNFYRLKIGAFTYAGGIFPLGWRRGDPVEVELFGGNLPAPVKVRPDLNSARTTSGIAMVPVPGAPGSLPFPFALSDRREILEPTGPSPVALEAGTVVNGRISQPQEVDRYKLAVSPGDHWLVELDNASLGTSRLYGVLSIYDSNGKKLASTGDSGVDPEPSFLVSARDTAADPYLAFKVPPGVQEIIVTVEDLLQRGGADFGYRLVAEKQPHDFQLTLSTPFVNIPLEGSVSLVAVAERRGYLGPIQLSIPDLPDDLLVEGGHIPGETGGQTLVRVSRQGILTITPKPGAKTRVLDLAVWGEGVLEDGQTIRRRARGQGMVTTVRGTKQKPVVAPWLNLELPAMVVKERPVSLEVVTPRYVKLIQGMEYDVEWKLVRRLPGVRPPARVNEANIPGVGNLRVLRGKTKEGGDTGVLTMVTTVGTPPMKFDMLLDATVTIDGREERVTAPAITFDVVQGYTIEPPLKAVMLPPGHKVEVVGRIRWEAAFSAPVAVKAENLPAQVSCRPAEISARIEQFRLPCEAGPSAAPGEYEIDLVSSSTLAGRDKENVPYTIPPVKARLIIPAPEKAAQAANKEASNR